MSFTDASEQALLDLIFLNTNWANIGDATGLRGSSAAGNFWISLHTADPGEGGTATTNETSYGSYARQSVSRSGTGWTRSGSTISNVAAVTFPSATSGTATITHFGIVTSSSGAGSLLIRGALSSSIAVSTGVQPQFAIGALTISVD
ncbi:MAG: hypothetical protein IM620_17545 [Cytophagales bacterium]|nr:hypothetical protein [Cytophagales bacterium]